MQCAGENGRQVGKRESEKSIPGVQTRQVQERQEAGRESRYINTHSRPPGENGGICESRRGRGEARQVAGALPDPGRNQEQAGRGCRCTQVPRRQALHGR